MEPLIVIGVLWKLVLLESICEKERKGTDIMKNIIKKITLYIPNEPIIFQN